MYYAGIDPGRTKSAPGGIGFVKDAEVIGAWRMPQQDWELLALLRRMAPNMSRRNVTIAIERQWARTIETKTGKRAMCKGSNTLVGHYHYIRGACEALGFKVLLPTPVVWRKVIYAGTAIPKERAERKRLALEFAHRLFPSLGQITEGEAEGLLLAEYARRLSAIGSEP